MQTNVPYMTAPPLRIPQKHVLVPCLAALILLLFPTEVANGVRAGLSLCVRALIPSLFPFLCIAPLTADALSALCGGSTRRAALRASFVIGMLCGAPMGALTLTRHQRRGPLTAEDVLRFAPVVSVPSPAFMIGYVGSNLFLDVRIGWGLYAVMLLLSLLGFVWYAKHPATPEPASASHTTPVPPHTLSDTVGQGAERMLSVCAVVVFFTVVRSLLSDFCAPMLPTPISSLLGGMFEMTGGIASLAACTETAALPPHNALLGIAFLASSGGFSVGMQVRAVLPKETDGSPFFLHYILYKCVFAFGCTLMTALLLAVL